MDLQLKNKKALICASSKGLGFATAEALALEGAEVFLCARNETALKEAAQSIEQKTSRKVHYASTDLAQTDRIPAFAEHVTKTMQGLHILVNNTGGPPPTPAKDTPKDAWQQGFEQVFLSTTLLTTALLPNMIRAKFGRILTITSSSVIEPIENLCISTAMRTAVTAWSKTLATELAQSGVTVNTVMPGVIHTDRVEFLRRKRAERLGTTFEDEMNKTAKEIPMGRLGKAEEFAALLTFLASEKASYITGSNFSVDGGLKKTWV